MKILYWNIRGIGNLDSRLVLKKLCYLHKPDFLFISEPWIEYSKLSKGFVNSLNLKLFATNDRGTIAPNIWCFCKTSFDPVILVSSDQHVSFSIFVEMQELFISAIYTSTNYIVRRSLWNELTTLESNNPGPWCFIGDFNSILGAHEYSGRGSPSRISCDEFRNWSDAGQYIHINTRGSQFTWTNGRKQSAYTEKRLDRSICNVAWIDFWNSIDCLHSHKKQIRPFPSAFEHEK